jgi:hypothetical protein
VLRILLILVMFYGLLFVLPPIYEEKPRKTANFIAAVLYALFLVPSSFVLTFLSAAIIDSLRLDKHLPGSVVLMAMTLLAALIFTALATVPLLLTRRKRKIKKPVGLLFLASFLWDLVLIAVFGFLTAG